GTLGGTPQAAAPAIQVSYRDAAGAHVGAPQIMTIEPLGFAGRAAQLNVPAGSATAEIRMTLPAGTRMQAEELQMQPQSALAVPCTFIAQSPGELHVAAAQIVYDRKPLPPPLVPPAGLSAPTPPGSKPGDPECACEECDADAVAVAS